MSHAARSIQNHPPVGTPTAWKQNSNILQGFRQGEALAALWIRLSQEERSRVFGTAKDAAAILGVQPKRIYGMHDEGKLPSIKIFGRLFIHLPSLLEWIIRGEDLPPVPPRSQPRPFLPPVPSAQFAEVRA